jgi:hypothetical protein
MTLCVAVTVDADNDDFSIADQRDRMSWRGLDLIPDIAAAVHEVGWPATWFVRGDPQLQEVYGSAGYLLESFEPSWRKLADHGDEIGWHPHITRLRHDGLWESERDDGLYSDALRKAHAELRAHGYQFKSARMGEAIGSNLILKTLVDLGLRVDSSAIPGRSRNDTSRRFDWSPTPNKPYRPSTADYRVPGQPCLPILEVPMTTIPVLGGNDPEPYLRYASLAYHPSIFLRAIKCWFDTADCRLSNRVLTLILHPDELMARNANHPLYAFSIKALRANIDALIAVAKEQDVDIVGLTIGNLENFQLEPD